MHTSISSTTIAPLTSASSPMPLLAIVRLAPIIDVSTYTTASSIISVPVPGVAAVSTYHQSMFPLPLSVAMFL
jgi:hypothetical protein